MTTDTFLFNAGWLFFAAFVAVIAVVTITAFGRELLTWNSPGTIHKSSTDQTHPTR